MPGPLTALLMHPVVREELLRPDHIERLRRCVTLVQDVPFRDLEAAADHLGQIQILVTSWGAPRISNDVALTMPRLKLIAHLAGTVKGFIDETVWRTGVQVTNAVAANAVPVAEFTLAAILFANKRVLTLSRFYCTEHEIRAPWTREAPDAGNYHKTVGVIGASHVGRHLLQLMRAYDLDVLLYDPFVTTLTARELGARKAGLSELLSESDVVTLHAPLLPETRHMLGVRELALMRSGATLINTARGALIDHDALQKELESGRLNAVLDTTEPEVLPPDSPLYRLPNVLLTPHIAGSLGREAERLADQIVGEVERFALGRPLKHAVRLETLGRLA